MDTKTIKRKFYDVFSCFFSDFKFISIEQQESFTDADKFIVVVRLFSFPIESLFKLYRSLGSKSHVYVDCGVKGTLVFTIYIDRPIL